MPETHGDVRPDVTPRFRRPGALGLVVVLVSGLASGRCGTTEPKPALLALPSGWADLQDAISREGVRPVLGRLSGIGVYAPYRHPGRLVSSPPALRIAAARLDARAPGALDELAARGVADLVAGRLDSAVSHLQGALLRAPDSAPLLNDASVAYLERARRLGRFGDYAWALASAERALSRAPRMKEAAFNRALALKALQLRREAYRSLEEYRAADPSAWGQEAATLLGERHLHSVGPDPRPADRGADPPGDRRPRSRQGAREEIEEKLLPAWASAHLRGDGEGARVALRDAAAEAEALAAAGGDDMPRAAVARIARLRAENAPARLGALARAHLDFAEARELLLALRLADAASAAERAARGFSEGGSPYRLWAPVYRAISDRIAGRPELALVRLENLEAGAPRGGYGHWHGRVLWTRAVSHSTLGRIDVARAELEEACRLFRDLDEPGNESAVRTMLAEALADLGDYAQAWEEQGRALELLQSDLGRTRADVTLLTAAILANREGLPEVALHLYGALIAENLRRGDWGRLAEARLHRANASAALARWEDAESDLRTAEATASRISDPGYRTRLSAELKLAWAGLPRTAPAAALADATEALDHFVLSRHSLAAVPARVLRARAHAALGHTVQAQADLEEAIAGFEAQRARLASSDLQSLSFEEGRAAFAEMIRLQAVRRRDPDRALQYSERSRGSTGTGRPPLARPPTPEVVSKLLPPDTVVIYYVSLDDRLLVWTVAPKGVRFVEQPVTRRQLEASLAGFLRGLTAAAPAADLRSLSRPLWEALLAPSETALRSATHLVFVPDGPLHALPFPAVSRPSGRYLVEDFAITIAPSMAMAARALPPGQVRSILTVGDGHAPVAALPRLRNADLEADAVGRLYPRCVSLTAAGARVGEFRRLAPSFDAIHFAGHSIVSPDRPQFSRLLFAPHEGRGDALFPRDIEALPLRRTRLVVLASCSPAAGRRVEGEGVLNLVRPFLNAGAAYVIASLWPVDDTRQLAVSERLHRQVRAGLRPAEALRAVQLEMLRSAGPGPAAVRTWGGVMAYGGGFTRTPTEEGSAR